MRLSLLDINMGNKHQTIVRLAEEVLTDAFGGVVQLEVTQELESDRKLVLRCAVKGAPDQTPANVVLKQMSVDHTGAENQQVAFHWFLNEWAGLQFLTGLPDHFKYGPQLYASHSDQNLMILEDLGQHLTLMDLLNGVNAQEAEEALVRFGGYLGQMHAATYAREDEFSAIKDALGMSGPFTADAGRDIRKDIPSLRACLAALKVTPPEKFYGALDQLEAKIHGPGPFRVYVHGDAGPHNVLRQGPRLKLFDFEFATFNHALVDAVGARMTFPSAYRGLCSPMPIIRRLEASYQAELAKRIPQAAEESQFRDAIVQACAHWTLIKLIPWWESYLKGRLAQGKVYDVQDGRTTERSAKSRQRMVAFLRAFVATSEEFDLLPIIRDALQGVVNSLLKHWPDLKPLPYFPAFKDGQ